MYRPRPSIGIASEPLALRALIAVFAAREESRKKLRIFTFGSVITCDIRRKSPHRFVFFFQ